MSVQSPPPHAPYRPRAAQAVHINIEEVRGRLIEWISQDQVAQEVKRRFRHFLKTYEEEGRPYYLQKIRDMQSSK